MIRHRSKIRLRVGYSLVGYAADAPNAGQVKDYGHEKIPHEIKIPGSGKPDGMGHATVRITMNGCGKAPVRTMFQNGHFTDNDGHWQVERTQHH